jgi:hypothetical protein
MNEIKLVPKKVEIIKYYNTKSKLSKLSVLFSNKSTCTYELLA